MKTLATLALVSITMSSVAMADQCCKPAGCSPDRNCMPACKPVVKKVDITATCYNIETKTICIPPTRFPWDPSPCDGVCGSNCGAKGECGADGKCAAGGACTPAGRCGAGCGNGCESGGLLSGLRAALGMSNCATSKCVKSPKKSSKKVGEKCVCTWETCSNDVCGGAGCKPACAAPSVAPKASAPVAPPEEATPAVAPAPPEAARRSLFPLR
ncbi:MAG: hypothetical protein O2945_02670 [Planctomycetota bacterium]|nr:hypothetical protein [Planctomycetota bacterium]MDA0917955.1 hypothetical protein [Planctomycetota bacterium]